MKSRLNVDVGKSVSDLEDVAKSITMRNKLYKILFRGKGPIFEGFRVYSPDDSSENIDWRASVRSNKLLVKQYKEEREIKFVFVIDVSDSMIFGSSKKLKCEYAAELVAAFSNLILKVGDKAGILLYSDKVKLFIPPSSKRGQFEYIVDVLSNSSNYGGKPKLLSALNFMVDNFGSRIDAVIFVSDFTKVSKEDAHLLNLFSHIYETMAFIIKDKLDRTLPDIDHEIVIEDPSTLQQKIINPMLARKKYEKYAMEQEKSVKSVFNKSRTDFLLLTTDKPFVDSLVGFLNERAREGRFI